MEIQKPKPLRPTFLTIICILSFVGLGWTLLNSLFTIGFGSVMSPLSPLVQQELGIALDEVRASGQAAAYIVEGIFEGALKFFEILPLYGLLSFIMAGIALAGVILMWNLNKIGFYLYAAGKMLIVLLPFMLLGSGFLPMIMAFTNFFGTALFITLYAVNFKHLK